MEELAVTERQDRNVESSIGSIMRSGSSLEIRPLCECCVMQVSTQDTGFTESRATIDRYK